MASVAMDSPVGRLLISEEDGAVTALNWSSAKGDGPTPLLDEARRQLEAYFAGRLKQFELPLAPEGTGFQRRVWDRMLDIPYGGTASYGEMARDLKTAARAVGGACGRNPIPIIVPCHRVLGGQGMGGYSGRGGLQTKRFLLALEGAALI